MFYDIGQFRANADLIGKAIQDINTRRIYERAGQQPPATKERQPGSLVEILFPKQAPAAVKGKKLQLDTGLIYKAARRGVAMAMFKVETANHTKELGPTAKAEFIKQFGEQMLKELEAELMIKNGQAQAMRLAFR